MTDGSQLYAPLLQLFFGIPAEAVSISEMARTRQFTEEVRLASASNIGWSGRWRLLYARDQPSPADRGCVRGGS